MQCRYVRMAVLEEPQVNFISVGQTRSAFIETVLGENREFNHNRSTLYYSPRFVSDNIVAGVIERKTKEKIKTGPLENESQEVETYNITNFAIRLNGGQEVAIQENKGVFSGDAVKLFQSLAESINNGTHNWHIDFRHMGSKRDLDEYISKNSGAMKKITITFEMPNSDYGILQDVHDDLRDSLLNINGDKLKKEYQSSRGTLAPDQKVLDEMHLANGGTGAIKISNKDDHGAGYSFNSESTEYTSVIEENRRIDEISSDEEFKSVAEAMLGGAKDNE